MPRVRPSKNRQHGHHDRDRRTADTTGHDREQHHAAGTTTPAPGARGKDGGERTMTTGRAGDGDQKSAPRDITPSSLEDTTSGSAVTGADIDPDPPQETPGDDVAASEATSFDAATAPGSTTGETGSASTDAAASSPPPGEKDPAAREAAEAIAAVASRPRTAREAATPAELLRIAAEQQTSTAGVPTSLPGDDDVDRVIPADAPLGGDQGGNRSGSKDLLADTRERLEDAGEAVSSSVADVAADVRRKVREAGSFVANASDDQSGDDEATADRAQSVTSDLSDRAGAAAADMSDRAGDIADDAKAAAGDIADDLKTAARGVTETLSEAASDVRDRAADAVDSSTDLTDQRNQVDDAVADARGEANKLASAAQEAGESAVGAAREAAAEATQATREATNKATGAIQEALPGDTGSTVETVLTAGGTPRTQRLVAGAVLLGTTSGLARWAVRRLGGPDLSWLGPARIRPAVLGVGLAALAASLYVDNED